MDILTIRRAARMGQVELSQRAQISRPRLSAAENGYITLSESEIERIQAVIREEPYRRAQKIHDVLREPATVEARSLKPREANLISA